MKYEFEQKEWEKLPLVTVIFYEYIIHELLFF